MLRHVAMLRQVANANKFLPRGVANGLTVCYGRWQMSSVLKSYRASHGLSQQEVADKLAISRQMVQALETGKRKCTADMALLIEDRLGIDREVTLPKIFKRRSGDKRASA